MKPAPVIETLFDALVQLISLEIRLINVPQLFQPSDGEIPLGRCWAAYCVLITKKASLFYGFAFTGGIQPIYANNVFRCFWVIFVEPIITLSGYRF